MVNRRGRRGSDSRCCDEGSSPLTWHDYVDETHASIEAFKAWLATLHPFALNGVTGEIEALFDEAAAGRLEDTGDEKTPIKPAHPDPEIYELRLKSLSKALRFYHGEPARFPSHLIALHMHIKTSVKEQRSEISYSTRRYVEGAPSKWGLHA